MTAQDTSSEIIVLVDDKDRVMGSGEKHAVHQAGRLHRAFSVLIHDGMGNWLLHQRAAGKYHSGGLWTNTACGHPRPHETVAAAARRRLAEEMGFDCPLEFHGINRYRADLDNGMIENEIVHVFIGRYDGPIQADPKEVAAYEWMAANAVRPSVDRRPDRFTFWFAKYVREFWDDLQAA